MYKERGTHNNQHLISSCLPLQPATCWWLYKGDDDRGTLVLLRGRQGWACWGRGGWRRRDARALSLSALVRQDQVADFGVQAFGFWQRVFCKTQTDSSVNLNSSSNVTPCSKSAIRPTWYYNNFFTNNRCIWMNETREVLTTGSYV